MFNKIDTMGKTMISSLILVFSCLEVYMYFKGKTEVALRKNGIYARNISKEHGILYNEIAKLNKTRRVGKSGHMIIVFYLLVIEKRMENALRILLELQKIFL